MTQPTTDTDFDLVVEDGEAVVAAGTKKGANGGSSLGEKARDKAAKKGHANPDGSYIINNVADLKNAIQAIGRSKNPDQTKALIKRRAKALGHPELIPSGWGVQGIEFDGGSALDLHTMLNDAEFFASLGYPLSSVVVAAAGKKETNVRVAPGNHNLRNYWTHGAGAAKIGWGTDGSFRRCVAEMGKYVARPQGLCADYHKEATGEWPTEHGKAGIPSAVDIDIHLDTQPRFVLNVLRADAAGDTAQVDIDHDGSWTGVIAVEDAPTGDQRQFAPGSLNWADTSSIVHPLQWAPENLGEHKGSRTVGRIDQMWRDQDDPRVVWGSGRFDLGSEHGQEAFRQVKEGFLAGISIDPDQITDEDVELVFDDPAPALASHSDEEGNEVADSFDKIMQKPKLTVYHAGRIRGATLVAFPAFIEAAIQLTSTATAEPAHQQKEAAMVASVDTPWKPITCERRIVDEDGNVDGLVASGAFAVIDLSGHHEGETPDYVARQDCRFLHHEITEDGEVGPANLTACAVHIDAIVDGRTFGLTEDAQIQAYRHLAGHIQDAGLEPRVFELVGPIAVTAALDGPPPLEWFTDPKLSGPSPIRVTDDGRVFGHAAVWGTCHTSFPNTCVTPPLEQDYSYFTTGEVMTADGYGVAVGQITLGTSHAPTRGVSLAKAIDHYGDTGTAVADVAAGADDHGIWISGAVRPGTSGEHLHALRASALSGDWRRIAGSLRMVALLAVNVPGFPIPRTSAGVAQNKQVSLVAAGVLDPEMLEGESIDFAAEVEKLAGSCGIPLSGGRKKRKTATMGLDDLKALVKGV
jgi:hypothetical protein